MTERSRLDAATEDALRSVSTATLASQLAHRGIRTTFLVGVKPLRPDLRMVGRAVTLRYVPAREDVGAGHSIDNKTNVQRIAVELVGPGDVLVIDARGDLRGGVMGNILAARVLQRGAAGVVTDGAFRDSPGFAELDLPTYAAGANAALSTTIHHPVDIGVPIACAGVLVMPDDILVGDAEGVIVIPASLVDEVAADALEQERLETFILGRVEAGAPLEGTYPASDESLAAYRKGS